MSKALIRSWLTTRGGVAAHGDEDAVRLGHALAQISDADFIQSVIDAKTLLDRVGGQVFIGAPRQKFDRDGNAISEGAGEYVTVAYFFNYSSRLDPAIDRHSRGEFVDEAAEPEVAASPEPAPPQADTESVSDGASAD
jgi:hypothetical protein